MSMQSPVEAGIIMDAAGAGPPMKYTSGRLRHPRTFAPLTREWRLHSWVAAAWVAIVVATLTVDCGKHMPGQPVTGPVAVDTTAIDGAITQSGLGADALFP